MDRRNRTILLHAAVWLQRLNGNGRPFPEQVLTSQIKTGEKLLRWTCHDADDFIFDLLDRAGLIGPSERWSYDGETYELRFEAATLWEHLAFDPAVGAIDDTSILRAFVEKAWTGVGPQSGRLVPEDERWFTPWSRLIDSFHVLVAEGYAQRDGNRYRLTRRLLGLLAEWGWSVELDSDAHKRRLMEIWDSMPEPLKAQLAQGEGPSALELAMIMGYCWHEDEGWTYPPAEGMDRADRTMLKGGHIPTAIGIFEILRAETGQR